MKTAHTITHTIEWFGMKLPSTWINATLRGYRMAAGLTAERMAALAGTTGGGWLSLEAPRRNAQERCMPHAQMQAAAHVFGLACARMAKALGHAHACEPVLVNMYGDEVASCIAIAAYAGCATPSVDVVKLNYKLPTHEQSEHNRAAVAKAVERMVLERIPTIFVYAE